MFKKTKSPTGDFKAEKHKCPSCGVIHWKKKLKKPVAAGKKKKKKNGIKKKFVDVFN